MVELKEIIFVVEEDAEGGFTARALGESIFTEAATMDELRTAIRDALKCHFNTEADIPRIIRLHHVHDEVLLYA
ncbi:MAG: hypothetical protein KAU31_12445 [Spirochaetaceae bacterium]|nr:hypothetical protein [Spirochaetaceae bacterium]